MAEPLARSVPVIVSGALALAIIASIDALLCAKLAATPGELRGDGDRLLVRLGVSSAVAGAFGGITNGINIGPSVTNRAFGGRTWISVIVNALMLLAAATVLFPLVTYMPRSVLSAVIMVIAVQHLDPWSKQAAAQLFDRDTPQRAAIALDLAVALFVSVLSIAVNVVLAVFIGIALAVFLFVLRMSRSSVRRTLPLRPRALAEIAGRRRNGSARGQGFGHPGDRIAGCAVLRQRRAPCADHRPRHRLRHQRRCFSTFAASPTSTPPARGFWATSTRRWRGRTSGSAWS